MNANTKAVIDVGSNSVILSIGRCDPVNSGLIQVLDEQVRYVRLAAGIDQNGYLQEAYKDRLQQTLLEFSEIAKSWAVTEVKAFGTEACRKLADLHEFKKLFEKHGWGFELLSGQQEAFLSWHGAHIGLANFKGFHWVVDTGGASTEVVLGMQDNIFQSESFAIGSVTLKNSYKNWEKLDVFLTDFWHQRRCLFSHNPLAFEAIWVAGVAYELSRILSRWENRPMIHGYYVGIDKLQEFWPEFKNLKPDDLVKDYGVPRARADLLHYGVIILKTWAEVFEVSDIYLSYGGWRWAVLRQLCCG